MEEARFSINIKFSVQGFESQLTVREDEGSKVQLSFDAAMAFPARNNCPANRLANGGNGHTNGQAVQTKSDKAFADLGAGPTAVAVIAQPKPVAAIAVAQGSLSAHVCPRCGEHGHIELITFTDKKTGQPKSAYKCQSCSKWLR